MSRSTCECRGCRERLTFHPSTNCLASVPFLPVSMLNSAHWRRRDELLQEPRSGGESLAVATLVLHILLFLVLSTCRPGSLTTCIYRTTSVGVRLCAKVGTSSNTRPHACSLQNLLQVCDRPRRGIAGLGRSTRTALHLFCIETNSWRAYRAHNNDLAMRNLRFLPQVRASTSRTNIRRATNNVNIMASIRWDLSIWPTSKDSRWQLTARYHCRLTVSDVALECCLAHRQKLPTKSVPGS